MHCLDNDLSRLLAAYYFYKYHGQATAVYRLNFRSNYLFSDVNIREIETKIYTLLTSIVDGSHQIAMACGLKGNSKDEFSQAIRSSVSHVKTFLGSSENFFLYIEGTIFAAALITTQIQTIINEIVFRSTDLDRYKAQLKNSIIEEIHLLDKYDPDRELIFFSELGTRRRLSLEYQVEILELIKEISPERLTGTGNRLLSQTLNISCGALPHHDIILAEFANAGSLSSIAAETTAIKNWFALFPLKYQIPITDTFGVQSFLDSFSGKYVQKINSVRHDSGCPEQWARKIAKHYEAYDVNAIVRTFVFTDSLKFSDLPKIHSKVSHLCIPRFGLGTHFTGAQSMSPISSTIKLINLYGQFVSKKSEDIKKNYSPTRKDIVQMNSGKCIVLSRT